MSRKLFLFLLLTMLTVGGGIYITSGQAISLVNTVDPDDTAFVDGVPASSIAYLDGRRFGFTCGVDTITDADDNVYDTIQIGEQCWTVQSMRVGTRIDGSETPSDNGIIEKYCYGDNEDNCTDDHPNEPDGALYTWNEAMQYSTTEGAQGICPDGWHIPTHDEFTILERALCTSGTCETDFPFDTTTTSFRGTDEGTQLKPNGTSSLEWNLAGYRSTDGSFFDRGSNGVFWSSSESSGSDAWFRSVNSGEAGVNRVAATKAVGLSVRCLKD